MDAQVNNLITPELLVQLGFSVVFLVFLWMVWKKLEKREEEQKRERENYRTLLKDEREKREEITEKVIVVTEGVKTALNSNTDVMEKVLDRFDETMRNK